MSGRHEPSRELDAQPPNFLKVPRSANETDRDTFVSTDGPRSPRSGSWDQDGTSHSTPPTSVGDEQARASSSNEPWHEKEKEDAVSNASPKMSTPRLVTRPADEVARSPSPGELASQSSTPTRSDAQTRLDKLLRNLRTLAQKRMRIFDRRQALKERGKLVSNLQEEMVTRTRDLIAKIKTRLPSADVDELDDLEIDFEEIEEFVTVSLEMCQKFNEEQRITLDEEWDLCGLEDETYGKHEMKDSPFQQAIDEESSAGPEPTKFSPLNLDELLNISDLPVVNGPDPASPDYRARDPPYISILISSEHENENTPERIPEGRYEYGDALSDQSSSNPTSPRTSRDRLAQYAVDNEPEDNLGEGYQFVHVDTESAIFEAENADLLRNGSRTRGFSMHDLQAFTRWLVYGTPWNEHLATSEKKLLSAISNMDFIRTWVIESLHIIVSGQPASSNIPTVTRGRSEANLKRLVGGWQWDPATMPGTLSASDDSVSADSGAPLVTVTAKELRSTRSKPPPLRLPAFTETSNPPLQGGESAAPNRPDSSERPADSDHDHRGRRPLPLDEHELPRYSRHDFPARQQQQQHQHRHTQSDPGGLH